MNTYVREILNAIRKLTERDREVLYRIFSILFVFVPIILMVF